MEFVKPHIIHSLANAELYCMALSHLYQDPNFHNLNHWGIIQALARKGIFVAEPADCALTETVLIQTNPLKMVKFLFDLVIDIIDICFLQSAHMAVTEALMALFVKEMFSLDRVLEATKRLNKVKVLPETEVKPNDQEEALLHWLSRCCLLQKLKAEDELEVRMCTHDHLLKIGIWHQLTSFLSSSFSLFITPPPISSNHLLLS